MPDWEPVVDESDLEVLRMVLSPGRCGTTSLYHWLNGSGIKAFKTHFGTRGVVSQAVAARKKTGQFLPLWLEQNFILTGKAINEAKRVEIVVPLRNPVTRAISAFRKGVETGRFNVPKKLTSSTLTTAFEKSVTLGASDRWLDRELFPLIPSEAIPDMGDDLSMVVDHGRFSVLFLKAELPDPRKQEALSKFFSTDVEIGHRRGDFGQMKRKMKAHAKEACRLFPEFMPDWYFSAFKDMGYSRKFYTPDDIAAAWEKRLDR